MKVGLIGSGFMGRAHVLGFAAAGRAFELAVPFELAVIADATPEQAAAAARALGFQASTGDWRNLINDPDIGLIDITAPTALHKEIALAAITAGKHVYCEKPLAPSARDALDMAKAAEKAGVKTQVGFNYLANPMFALARDMIAAGELGEIYNSRFIHAEDYMSDPEKPYTFRHGPGGGALADIGSHALATAEFLLGPVVRVMGDGRTVIPRRKDAEGRERDIEVDDVTRAFVEFENGATGSIEADWCATGRKMRHDFEIYGAKGALCFTQERLNELHFYSSADKSGMRGFRRIEAGPEHPPYGRFCPAPGHQLGFNDLKAVEIARFSDALAGAAPEPFNFRAGWRIQSLVETVHESSRARQWIKTAPQ